MDAETLEAELIRDLSRLERLDDEEFSTELYRALTNTRWARAPHRPARVAAAARGR
jgi:hypothetical protein